MRNIKYRKFLKSILKHTDHTLSSLSEILDIPKRKLLSMEMCDSDFAKIDELWYMLKKVNCPWIGQI